jgi:hypothetical protein
MAVTFPEGRDGMKPASNATIQRGSVVDDVSEAFTPTNAAVAG